MTTLDIGAWDNLWRHDDGVTLCSVTPGPSTRIGGWDVRKVRSMNNMSVDAVEMFMGRILIKISALGIGRRVRSYIKEMFAGAWAFDQDLGWCVKAGVLSSGRSTFQGTKCESTRCGVRREEFDTCDEVVLRATARPHRPSCPSCLLRRMRRAC